MAQRHQQQSQQHAQQQAQQLADQQALLQQQQKDLEQLLVQPRVTSPHLYQPLVPWHRMSDYTVSHSGRTPWLSDPFVSASTAAAAAAGPSSDHPTAYLYSHTAASAPVSHQPGPSNSDKGPTRVEAQPQETRSHRHRAGRRAEKRPSSADSTHAQMTAPMWAAADSLGSEPRTSFTPQPKRPPGRVHYHAAAGDADWNSSYPSGRCGRQTDPGDESSKRTTSPVARAISMTEGYLLSSPDAPARRSVRRVTLDPDTPRGLSPIPESSAEDAAASASGARPTTCQAAASVANAQGTSSLDPWDDLPPFGTSGTPNTHAQHAPEASDQGPFPDTAQIASCSNSQRAAQDRVSSGPQGVAQESSLGVLHGDAWDPSHGGPSRAAQDPSRDAPQGIVQGSSINMQPPA